MKILCKNSCVFENKHFSLFFFPFEQLVGGGAPFQQSIVARVAHPHRLGGGGQRHAILAAGVAENIATVPAVVPPACNAELFVAKLAVGGLFIRGPLGFSQVPRHVLQSSKEECEL